MPRRGIDDGYRTVYNVGPAGQSVFHASHLLVGRDIPGHRIVLPLRFSSAAGEHLPVDTVKSVRLRVPESNEYATQAQRP